MIITDNSKRPSERFIEIVKDYFGQRGYSFKKSSKEFVLITDRGSQTVGLRFYTTIDLVSANLYWKVTFQTLEKIFATLNGHPKKFKNEPTLITDLLNYSLCRQDDAEFQIPLFDNTSLKYDDFILNESAIKIMGLFEKYIEPFFKKYNDYSTLEKSFNQLPITNSNITPSYSKHASYGILLAKYFDRPDFDQIITSYRLYAEKMHDFVKNEMLEIIDKTLLFISTNNTKLVLTN